MSLFLNFRTGSVGGDIVEEPYVLEGDGLVDPIALRTLGWTIPPERIAGREVVFTVHGFNVSYAAGVRTLALLERNLGLDPGFVLVGVLWPGDYWIPVVNYPSEAGDAARCGVRLAKFADAHLRLARSISFVSHSLGARLLLEAVKGLGRRVREVCLAAGAVDDDCLNRGQYAEAWANADRVTVLASTKDMVLRLAYVAGDFLSDITYDNDSPWRKALGYHGPRPTALEHLVHAQIAPADAYGHGDYLAPSTPAVGKPDKVRKFIGEVLSGSPHPWP